MKFSGIFPRTGYPLAHPSLLVIRPENLSTSRLTQLPNKSDNGLSTETTGSTLQTHERRNCHAAMLRHNRPSIIFYKAEITATRLPIYFPSERDRMPRTVNPSIGTKSNSHKATSRRKFPVVHSYKSESIFDKKDSFLLNENWLRLPPCSSSVHVSPQPPPLHLHL